LLSHNGSVQGRKPRNARHSASLSHRDERLAYILGDVVELRSDEAGEILYIESATFPKRPSRARQRVRQFMRGHCGLISRDAACSCARRVQRAIESTTATLSLAEAGAALQYGGTSQATRETMMHPMFLPDVEQAEPRGVYAGPIKGMQAAAMPVPQIMHLFAFKPDRTEFLSRFTQGVMRGPSPLSPGQRELIAAFTSRRNDCPF
jgi:hypothetical protein